MATRICKMKGRHNFVGGKDNNNIFEEGVIYNVSKILGTIMLTPIGKSPDIDSDGNKMSMLPLDEIIRVGDYLNPEK